MYSVEQYYLSACKLRLLKAIFLHKFYTYVTIRVLANILPAFSALLGQTCSLIQKVIVNS